MSEEKGTFESWTEEMTVAGSDLLSKLQEVLKDASVHRFRVVNNRTGEVVVDIPAAFGLGAAFLANIWAIIGAAVLYVADFQIVVEHRGPVSEDDAADVADEIIVHDEKPVEKAPPVEEVVVEDKPAPEKAAPAMAADQCQGTTKAGTQCKRKPTEGAAYCYAHQPA